MYSDLSARKLSTTRSPGGVHKLTRLLEGTSDSARSRGSLYRVSVTPLCKTFLRTSTRWLAFGFSSLGLISKNLRRTSWEDLETETSTIPRYAPYKAGDIPCNVVKPLRYMRFGTPSHGWWMGRFMASSPTLELAWLPEACDYMEARKKRLP